MALIHFLMFGIWLVRDVHYLYKRMGSTEWNSSLAIIVSVQHSVASKKWLHLFIEMKLIYYVDMFCVGII